MPWGLRLSKHKLQLPTRSWHKAPSNRILQSAVYLLMGGLMDVYSLIFGGTVNTGNLISNILFCACSVVLLGELKPSVRAIFINILEVVFLFGFASALEMVQYQLWGSRASLPSLIVTLFVYALIQRKRRATDRIVRCVTFVAAFVLAASMTGIMLKAFPSLTQATWSYSVPGYISYVVMIIFAVVLRIFNIEHFAYVPRYFVLLIVLIDVLGAAAGYSFINYNITHMDAQGDTYASIVLTRYEQNAALVNVQVDTAFLLLMLVSYLMFYVLAREHAERAELLVTEKADADTMSQMLVTREIYDAIRETRHELKNYNAYMSSLLEAGDYDALKEFFAAYGTNLEEVLDYVSSGNRLIDAVVNAKLALGRSYGVEFKTTLAVPEQLSVADDDMFRLLANLLDNAIEGTLASKTPKGPVRLKIMPHESYFVITVENPCNPRHIKRSSDGTFITSKPEEALHGYGTKVIREIAEKYQGSATFTVKDKIFTASVMLVAHAGEK